MFENFYTLSDAGINFAGKTVLVRADLDVPFKNGEVLNDYRIRKAIPTLRFLLEKQAKVVVLAHAGRPEGKYQDELSLLPVRFSLGHHLDIHIKFAHITSSKNSIKFMENGEILLLENLRFNPEEESTDPKVREAFVAELVGLADYFVFDAFASYREHASTYELAKAFDKPLLGLQIEKELTQLTKLKTDPANPYVAVIGGAKIDTKLDILKVLAAKANYLLIGGAMAYTFLKAQGISVGKSKVENEMLKDAKNIIATAKKNKCELRLPIDHIAGKEFEEGTKPIEVETQQLPNDVFGLDVGSRTLASYLEIIKSAKTILWNGPMGVFEWSAFSRGTEAIGEYIGLTAPNDVFKVAGGGDTVTAMEQLKVNMKNFNHVSTGGGAMLSFLCDEKMPSLEALKRK